jgi:hypothetical protein
LSQRGFKEVIMGPIKQALSAAVIGAGLMFPAAAKANYIIIHAAHERHEHAPETQLARVGQIDEQLEEIRSIYGDIQRSSDVLPGLLAPERFRRQLADLTCEADRCRAKAAAVDRVEEETIGETQALIEQCRSYAENLAAYRDFPGIYAGLKAHFDYLELESPGKYALAGRLLEAAEEAYQAGRPAEVRTVVREAEKALREWHLAAPAIAAAASAAATAAVLSARRYKH